MRSVEQIVHIEKMANAYKNFVRILKSLGRWCEDNIKMNIKEIVMIWTGNLRCRVGSSNRLLWTQLWTFGYHKMPEISWPA